MHVEYEDATWHCLGNPQVFGHTSPSVQLGAFYLDSTKSDVIRHSAGRLYSKLLKNLYTSHTARKLMWVRPHKNFES